MNPTDLAFAGVVRQAQLIRSGELSSRELVELYLDRIFRLDQSLNAFRVVMAEQALAEAQQADARRSAGEDRPLLGIPVAVKDDTDVRGEVSAKGSIAHGPPATADDELVRRLRSAGAVIIGKTNVPELMITPFTETPWYGATRNPWDLDRTPGGSSGGAAAAVAAGLVPLATATDGAGSIRIPAACCGLVGLKPQRGRIPFAKPDWKGLDVHGFVTRTVADSALALDCAGDFPIGLADAAARPATKLRVAISLGVPKGVIGSPDASQLGAVERVAGALRDLGHEVVEREADYGLSGPRLIGRYLAGIREYAGSMAHPERLGRLTRGFVALGLAPSFAIKRILAAEAADRERFVASFGDADVLLTPMFTRLPFRIGELEGKPAAWVLNREISFVPYPGMCNHTGQPAVAVPAGTTDDGFPLSAQIVGRPEAEPMLVGLAAQLEQALDWPVRRPTMAA